MRFALLAVLVLLAACAETPAPKAVAHSTSQRSSPEAVPAPPPPPGGFDQAQAAALVSTARDRRQAGHPAEARQAATRAAELWPADTAAWSELTAACEDSRCSQFAAFFAAKLEFLQGLPPHAAALGFQNIAEEDEGTKAGDFTYDRTALDMARRLWTFYAQAADTEGQTTLAHEKTWGAEHPVISILGIGGTVAGVLTGIKSAANK